MSSSTKMKVCVIGGGIGGLTVCTSLRQFARDHRQVEIYLIEPKEYIEIPWCSIRNIFDVTAPDVDVDLTGRSSGNWTDASIIPIERWANMKGVKHIRATCNRLTKNHVELSNGESIEFTVCCVCVGAQTRYQGLGRGPPKPVVAPPTGGQAHQDHHHHHPRDSGTISRRIHQLKHEKTKLLKSKSVAIIGGGLIGVEFAGELADEAKKQNKHIKITLIHSQDRLIPDEFTPKASEMALHKLQKLGINVKLNEKAVPIRRKSPHHDGDGEDESKQEDSSNEPSISPPPSPTKQSQSAAASTPNPNAVRLVNSNETFEADQIIWTTGLIPCNSSFLETKYLNSKGWIHVDEYFRIVGSDNKLFALGDCCDLLPNQGTQILGTFNIIGKNIKSVLKAIEKDKLHDEQYLQRKMRKALHVSGTIVVTIGKSTGVASPIFGNMHTQFGLPWLKNSTMFLYKPKQTIGLL